MMDKLKSSTSLKSSRGRLATGSPSRGFPMMAEGDKSFPRLKMNKSAGGRLGQGLSRGFGKSGDSPEERGQSGTTEDSVRSSGEDASSMDRPFDEKNSLGSQVCRRVVYIQTLLNTLVGLVCELLSFSSFRLSYLDVMEHDSVRSTNSLLTVGATEINEKKDTLTPRLKSSKKLPKYSTKNS